MKKGMSEIEKLKFYIDAEFSIMHIMFAVVVFLLTDNLFVHLVLCFYILVTALYALLRMAFVFADDPKYLKLPEDK